MSVDQEPLGLRWAGLSPAFSLLMPTVSLPAVPPRLTPGLQHHWNAPLPIRRGGSHSFGTGLMPENYRRRIARLVSYYALFQGMAASKPTS